MDTNRQRFRNFLTTFGASFGRTVGIYFNHFPTSSKAKNIYIYHRNGDTEFFQRGEKYQSLKNSEIIDIEYEQPNGYLGSPQLDIYIKYVVRDSANKETVRKVFLAQFNGDVFIKKIVGKNE